MMRPIEEAPKDGEFLAEDKWGNWLRVSRHDLAGKVDFVPKDAVICHSLGGWFTPSRFMPLPGPSETPQEGTE